jgi:hypothetical protein
MISGFLLDENLKVWWSGAIAARYVDVPVAVIGDSDSPPKGTQDGDVLLWCEAHGYALVSDNRSTMPGHLAQFVLDGRRMPGVFLVAQDAAINFVADGLAIIYSAGQPWEFQNQIKYLSEVV